MPLDIWDISVLFFPFLNTHNYWISSNYISKAQTLLQVSYFGIRN